MSSLLRPAKLLPPWRRLPAILLLGWGASIKLPRGTRHPYLLLQKEVPNRRLSGRCLKRIPQPLQEASWKYLSSRHQAKVTAENPINSRRSAFQGLRFPARSLLTRVFHVKRLKRRQAHLDLHVRSGPIYRMRGLVKSPSMRQSKRHHNATQRAPL